MRADDPLDRAWRRFDDAAEFADGEAALEEVEALAPDDPNLVRAYEDLAGWLADHGQFAEAARVQEKANARGSTLVGYDAWFLMEAGEVAEGERRFMALAAERPDDYEVPFHFGLALQACDRPHDTLAQFDRALELSGPDETAMIVIERLHQRRELGLPADGPDRVAMRTIVAKRLQPIAFIPRDRLPENVDEATYYAGVERLARSAQEKPRLLPIEPADLKPYDDELTLAFAASELAARADDDAPATRWPPERNAPCWCESGRKYKRCCGAA